MLTKSLSDNYSWKIYFRFTDVLLFIFFILLATVLNLFTIEGKNYLLIGYSFFSIGLLVLLNFRNFPQLKNTSAGVILLYMIFSFVINYKSSQLLSLVYSMFFIGTYIFFSTFIQSRISEDQYRKILRFTFLLYLAGLIAGQIFVYSNLFKPIAGIAGFLQGSFGTILGDDGFRFYSFSSEPSYAAFIVVMLYYSYISLELESQSIFSGRNLILFILLVYMILSFKSAYGIILLGLILVGHFGFSWGSILVYLSVPMILIGLSVLGYGFGAINRVVNIVQHVDLSDLHSLYSIDFNTYFRIAPFIHYYQISNWNDLALYFGHGASSSRGFVVPEIYAAFEGGEFLGGFLPAFLYDYGIVGMLLVIAFILKLLPQFFSIPTAIIFLLMFNANINTQLFWLIILCLTLNKHYRQQHEGIH